MKFIYWVYCMVRIQREKTYSKNSLAASIEDIASGAQAARTRERRRQRLNTIEHTITGRHGAQRGASLSEDLRISRTNVGNLSARLVGALYAYLCRKTGGNDNG